MLLLVYRSIVTMILILLMVFFELGAARGIVAFLGYYEIIGLSTFATSLLTLMVIAAGTDYAIFLIGRYQEARGAGEDRETAVLHDVSRHRARRAGVRADHRRRDAVPELHAAAVLPDHGRALRGRHVRRRPRGTDARPRGDRDRAAASACFEPKRAIRSRGWRRIGTAVVRWPGPILVATIALALVGLLALPSYKTELRRPRTTCPPTSPANVGYAVADRHFSAARMNPELLMVESDHDLRNSADFLVIDKIAKAIFRMPGIARVQTITRPDGKPIKHTHDPVPAQHAGHHARR